MVFGQYYFYIMDASNSNQLISTENLFSSLKKMANTTHKLKMLHAIIFPLPYQGHINPFVNLAIKLASTGFSITFVHTEYVHHTLAKTRPNNNSDKLETRDFFSQARQSGLDIRYATISDGFPVDFDRTLHVEQFWTSLLHDFPARVDEFVGNIIQSNPNLVSFLIADSFFSWSSAIAEKYKLVNVSFFTQPALVFTIGSHWNLITQNGHFPVKDNMDEEINYVPGVESIRTKDLMSYFKEDEMETAVGKAVFASFQEMKRADFMLHYTVEELESNTLEAISKNQSTYAIGPIFPFNDHPKITTVAKSMRAESDCTKWLDSKPPRSVLYISFGSVAQTSGRVVQEIAHALLLSGVNFLWVVREDMLKSGDGDGDDEILPAGFQEGVKDKGMIVPWCNQIAVLSHRGIGGFLTHCGWNSTFESLWCGVPMICNPVTYDQLTTRKLVVDDWKIGINLYDGSSIYREEVPEKIKDFMSGSGSRELREESEKIKIKLLDAMEKGGSSSMNFDRFITDLTVKICSTG